MSPNAYTPNADHPPFPAIHQTVIDVRDRRKTPMPIDLRPAPVLKCPHLPSTPS